MVGVPETTNRDLQYHVLPDDPLAALNVLRQAARSGAIALRRRRLRNPGRPGTQSAQKPIGAGRRCAVS